MSSGRRGISYSGGGGGLLRGYPNLVSSSSSPGLRSGFLRPSAGIICQCRMLSLSSSLSSSARQDGKENKDDDKDDSKTTDGGGLGLERQEGETLGKYFKRLTKDYWYVLIPVHLATSAVWITTFYALVKSGVDIGSLLERFGTSPEKVERLRESPWAHLLLAYACYKIATPARYTVTVAGTTLAVQRLRAAGYLRTTRQVREKIKSRYTDRSKK